MGDDPSLRKKKGITCNETESSKSHWSFQSNQCTSLGDYHCTIIVYRCTIVQSSIVWRLYNDSYQKISDSRIINALHQAIITDFLLGIVVQSYNRRTIVQPSYNRTISDCTIVWRLNNDSYQKICDDRLMKCIDYSGMISDSFRRLGFVTSDSFFFSVRGDFGNRGEGE